jgi:hypothetical protein
MSNSMNELPLSSLKNLSKYSRHLFFISSFFCYESLCLILNAFNLDDVPCLTLYAFDHLIDVLLPILHAQTSIYFIIHLTSYFTHHLFCGLFITLYCSMLSPLLSRCIQLKYYFFSLIGFCTFSCHHYVSLVLNLPLFTTPSYFETTLHFTLS